MVYVTAHDKKVKKPYTKIIYAIIAIIYLCIFAIVIVNYFNQNRYWDFDSEITSFTAEKGQMLSVNAVISNKMYYEMSSEDKYFVSYHIIKEDGEMFSKENPRITIETIEPGHEREILIQIQAPAEAGKYVIEIDIVKEDEYWFEDRGERPGVIYLTVT